MIKAVFFDIDGTLVSFKTHRIPDSTLYALNLLREKGIKTFIATGRSWAQIEKINDFPEFDGYVTLNGSCCITGDKQIIYTNCIPQEDLERLAEFQRTHSFPVEFVYADHETMTETNELVEAAWANVNVPVPPVVPMSTCSKQDVFQLGVFLNRKEEDELQLTQRFMPGCTSMRWSPDFYDIIPKESCKSSGIDKIIAYYGIDIKETMAFGDGGNDIDMIRHTAIGVAMGNANDDVKAAADIITSSVDEDGILNAIKPIIQKL